MQVSLYMFSYITSTIGPPKLNTHNRGGGLIVEVGLMLR